MAQKGNPALVLCTLKFLELGHQFTKLSLETQVFPTQFCMEPMLQISVCIYIYMLYTPIYIPIYIYIYIVNCITFVPSHAVLRFVKGSQKTISPLSPFWLREPGEGGLWLS